MNKNVLPTFQTFRPVGVQTAQMVVNFAHFQVQAGQRGVSGQTGGGIVNVHIRKRGVWRLRQSKEQGLGWYSGQKGTSSGHVGKVG